MLYITCCMGFIHQYINIMQLNTEQSHTSLLISLNQTSRINGKNILTMKNPIIYLFSTVAQ